MSKYQYTEKCKVSGFGGGYEMPAEKWFKQGWNGSTNTKSQHNNIKTNLKCFMG